MSEWEVALRLLAGTLAGMVIGIDRTRNGKGTGVRTLGLVGLGAAAATAIFDASGHEDAASRVVQGLLTGIGFLGAGVIMRRDTETFPHGLTTAASVWLTAALGAAAGSGCGPSRDRRRRRLRPARHRPQGRAAVRRHRRGGRQHRAGARARQAVALKRRGLEKEKPRLVGGVSGRRVGEKSPVRARRPAPNGDCAQSQTRTLRT